MTGFFLAEFLSFEEICFDFDWTGVVDLGVDALEFDLEGEGLVPLDPTAKIVLPDFIATELALELKKWAFLSSASLDTGFPFGLLEISSPFFPPFYQSFLNDPYLFLIWMEEQIL